jgi:myo-inositol-1-phosphate synthase
VSPIKVAVVGIGNCARSLVEGVTFYRQADEMDRAVGVRAAGIGGYGVADIGFVAAFDVSTNKVGKDLSDAILAPPNETIKLSTVPSLGVEVLRGPTLDGVGETLSAVIDESEASPTDVATALREAQADVVVSYLPTGSDRAARFYASAALEAGCGFVNCMPTSIASAEDWSNKFAAAGLPVVGDDVKSQMGATILHRSLLRLFRDRGVSVTAGYQLNLGGNADFLNMSQPERAIAKEGSKVRAIESMFSENFVGGPMAASVQYVPGLGDKKTAYIQIEGATFGGAPVSLSMKLDVWDSPNSAGVVVDAIRFAKLAMERGQSGSLKAACAFLMKSPPVQMDEGEAMRELWGMASGG